MNYSGFFPRIMMRVTGIAMLFLLTSCSASRWVAREKPVVDTSGGRLLHRKKVVVLTDSVTPSNPVLKFGTIDIDTKSYPRRLIEDRYIQSYQTRRGFLIAGLAAAGIMIYSANSSFFHGTKSARYALDAGGVLLASVSLLFRKPIGKPVFTGENRMIGSVGSVTRDDSVYDRSISDTSVTVNAFYGKRKMIDNMKAPIENGEFQVDLSQSMMADTIASAEPGTLEVKIGYGNDRFGFHIPIKKFMTRYAVAKLPLVSLHSMPEDNNINILADISYHTRLRYDSSPDSLWYKVLYGIAPTYLKTDESSLVWMISGKGSDLNTDIAEPYTGFGAVDVEQNIPDRLPKEKNGHAIVIDDAFDTLGSDAYKIIYRRDARLMSQYLGKTTGYPSEQVRTFDSSKRDSLISWIGMEGERADLYSVANPDSARLVVYYVGSDSSLAVHRKLLSLIDAVSNLKTASTAVLMDIYFGRNKPDTTDHVSEVDFHQSLEHRIRNDISRNPNLLVILSSSTGQNAGAYRSLADHLDKRHSIFTYYYCQALKQGLSNWAAIDNYLERNVTFTSRSLFEIPQDPVVFGNEDIPLIWYKKGN